MATARSRTNSTSSTSSVGSDNGEVNIRGPKNLLEQGPRSKNIVQRTRDALGDIGNRLKKNGSGVAGNGKPAFVIGKPALGIQNTGTFAVPIAPAPKAARKDANTKSQIYRSNSVTGSTNLNSNVVPPANKPKIVKAKVFTNLHRSQSVQLKNVETTKVSKENAQNEAKENTCPEKCEVSVEEISVADSKLKESTESDTVAPNIINSELENKDDCKNTVKRKEDEDNNVSEIKVVTEENAICTSEAQSDEPGKDTESKDVAEFELIEGFSNKRFSVVDIDANDDTNYFLVTDYIVDICDYLYDLEKHYPVRIRYLEGRLVNSRMRAVLMDWLVEVHNQFKFVPETLYIATKTMDRYLQTDRTITRKQLQLVGVTAMYIAAKFEEVCTPTVLDFAAVSDNAFSAAEVIKMEATMLRALGYDLAPPPSCFFLRRYSKAASSSIQLHGLAKYIMELSLIDYTTTHLFPSEQAAGALSLAMLVMEKKPLDQMWDATMQHYSKTTLTSLAPIITVMSGVLSRAHEEPTKLQAVTNKYAKARAFKVSKLPVLNVDEWKGRVAKELNKYKH